MEDAKGHSDALRAFYEDNLRTLEFGNGVADVILVPILILNLLGVIAIKGPYAPGLVAIFAFIDVTSTAILLVGGFVGSSPPRVACAQCGGEMIATVSYWTCRDCDAKLTPHKGTGKSKPGAAEPTRTPSSDGHR